MDTSQPTEPAAPADEATQPNAPTEPPEIAPPPPDAVETDVPPWMQCPNGGCCDG